MSRSFSGALVASVMFPIWAKGIGGGKDGVCVSVNLTDTLDEVMTKISEQAHIPRESLTLKETCLTIS